MGIHTTFTQEIADEICQRLAEGEPLRQICRDEHMPAWRTVYCWREQFPEFDTAISRARDIGTDAIAEDTLNLIDTEPEFAESWSNGGGSKHRDSAHVTWLKNRVEQRMKLLAKWNPKRYGDKLELAGNKDAPLTVHVVQLTDPKPGDQ